MSQLASIAAGAGGALLIVVAYVGCIVPVVPGPLLAAAALFLVSLAGGWTIYAVPVLVVWTVAAIAAQVLDNVLPARAAGRAGAGTAGVWGSVIGMVAGSLLLPPLGTFVGAFAGALVGELAFHHENQEPLKAALAVFRGTLGAIIVKLAVTGGITVTFVRGLFRLFGNG